ncbi:MAG: hypothetical protein ACJ766_10890 [Thermoleophilaceae bacterium]
MGVGGGDALGVERAAEPPLGARKLGVRAVAVAAELVQPGLRLLARAERLRPDDRRTRGGDRFRLRLLDGSAASPLQEAPLRRAERPQDEDGVRVAGRLLAKQVAPVGRTQQEPELELDEAEEICRGATRPGGPNSPGAAVA